MLIINGTDMRLTKGDTAHLVVSAVLQDELYTEYTWTESDIVYFSIRDKAVNYEPDVYLVRIQGSLASDGEQPQMTVQILPEDTENLESGRLYFYDIVVYIEGNRNEKYTILNGDFEVLGLPNRRWC